MISIKVPPLGESIVEATVSRWLKKKGEAVAGGDTLVELETDKITVEVPAPRAGVMASVRSWVSSMKPLLPHPHHRLPHLLQQLHRFLPQPHQPQRHLRLQRQAHPPLQQQQK